MWGGWTRGRRIEEPHRDDHEGLGRYAASQDGSHCSISTMMERRCGTVRDEDGKAHVKCETVKRRFKHCPGQAPVEIESNKMEEDVDLNNGSIASIDSEFDEGMGMMPGELGRGVQGGRLPGGHGDVFGSMLDEMVNEMARGFGSGLRFRGGADGTDGGQFFSFRHGGWWPNEGRQQQQQQQQRRQHSDDSATMAEGSVPQPPDLPTSARQATAEERRRDRMYSSVSTEV